MTRSVCHPLCSLLNQVSRGRALQKGHHAFASVSLPLWCGRSSCCPSQLPGVFFFFLKFLAIPYGLWDLSSSTRYQSHTPALEGKNLTTGLPGKCPCSLLMDSSTFPAASICFSQPKGFPHPPELRKVVLSRYRSS